MSTFSPFQIKSVFLFSLICFTAWSIQPIADSSIQQNQEWYQIAKFIDGDTFWVVDKDSIKQKVRLIGIDAPESRRTGRKEVGHFGKEAAANLEAYLTGKKVRLAYDVAKYDRYQRTLAYVYMEDGTFLNAKLVRDGYASVMTVPPNVKFADLFLKYQKEARNKKRGLWK